MSPEKFLLVFFGKEHGTQVSDLQVHISGPQLKFLRLQYTDPPRKATQNDFIAWVYTRRGTSSVRKEIFLSVFRQKYLFVFFLIYADHSFPRLADAKYVI